MSGQLQRPDPFGRGKGPGRSRRHARVLAGVFGLAGLLAGVLGSVDASAATAVPPTVWSPQLPTTSPFATSAGAMAYDPAIGKPVLVPGLDAHAEPLGGTWTYDGTTWTPVASSGPTVSGASMAFDPAIGQLVLFGGQTGSGNPVSDTWTYNGTAWTLASPITSPPARSGATMDFDPAINQMVLFGGAATGGTPLNDTWTFNGTTWTLASPTASPSPRSGAVDELRLSHREGCPLRRFRRGRQRQSAQRHLDVRRNHLDVGLSGHQSTTSR